jgi:hypothetical protein
MTGLFDSVIADLRAQKEKIDAAIEAIESLGSTRPHSPVPATESTKKPAKMKPARGNLITGKARVTVTAPVPVGRNVRRKSKTGLTRELVMKALASGPKTSGAVVAALAGKVEDTAVRAMLYHLKSKGKLTQNAEGAFEVAAS